MRLLRAKSFTKEFISHFRNSQITQVSAALAYTTLLSLIPFLAVSLALFKGLGGLEKLYDLIEPLLLDRLSTGSGEGAATAIRGFIENLNVKTLGAGGAIGVIITSLLLLDQGETAIQRIWLIKKKRPLQRRIAYYWAIISLGPLALAVTLGAITATRFQLPPFFSRHWVNWIGSFIVFLAVYRFTPLVPVKWKPALISASVTSTLWLSSSYFYKLYIEHVVNYNKIYGGAGAVPILLVWIFLGWIIILSGVVLCYVLQERSQDYEKAISPAPPPTQ